MSTATKTSTFATPTVTTTTVDLVIRLQVVGTPAELTKIASEREHERERRLS